jgi:hypothetical protein
MAMALSKETQRQVRPEQPIQAWKRVAERIRKKKSWMIVERLGERLVSHESPPHRYYQHPQTNRSLSAPITS